VTEPCTKRAGSTLLRDAISRELERRRAEFHAGVTRAGSDELHAIRRDPTSKLKDVFPAPLAEPRHLADGRLERVAMHLDFGVELRPPGLGF